MRMRPRAHIGTHLRSATEGLQNVEKSATMELHINRRRKGGPPWTHRAASPGPLS
ncbi:hypothetical protein OPAG_09200 [Rhodococcus opacus PD630]|nr:hypothetical protein Pd630_LPD00617 [Rhodococcus opacus PD630]EHI41919.1 hypothetical protein OPAG_09200 [Rhodococcus opacus PD630]